MSVDTEYTAKEVAAHREASDAWMAISGEVYDLTKYLEEHPGGADILIEAAGTDATEAFDNAGHSEDAFEIMADYRVGKLKGAGRSSAPKPVRVTLQTPPPSKQSGSSASTAVGGAVVSLGALAGAALGLRRMDLSALSRLLKLRQIEGPRGGGGLGFVQGFVIASALALVAGGVAVRRFSHLLDMEAGALHHAPHKKIPRVARADPLSQRGFLDPQTYHPLPLVEKELVTPNVYRLVFELPTPDTVLGLPIGQHVAIKTTIDGAAVQRSYTPVSNNADKGILELVIKVYDDGQLTGRYLKHLSVGDEVMFRGPKGAMRYKRGLCKKIGMLAGGTGITPMYQLIRAICEDERDTTEVSLIYANRTEDDILLRKDLEAFARRYPRNFSMFYLLDQPPEGWAYGTGYVTKELMADKFPDPSEDGSRVMLCGPPGMVSAAKKGLVDLGYEKPGASFKITDQVFCF
ncbi:putative nadh-cytochrome b5 reductase [Diaporthe ampelina]|uniref:Putative nadh-cytochrome b5 reductase n=1 Tax=Diaporthe ampelina TaxID=1214573 RepID=A0A0G2FJF8_9PEZI|nr:putative nadh-cytochrome b5 reductase [Diaporthe ampelina]